MLQRTITKQGFVNEIPQNKLSLIYLDDTGKIIMI